MGAAKAKSLVSSGAGLSGKIGAKDTVASGPGEGGWRSPSGTTLADYAVETGMTAANLLRFAAALTSPALKVTAVRKPLAAREAHLRKNRGLPNVASANVASREGAGEERGH